MKRLCCKGMTLLELLVVIAIIALLAGLIFTVTQPARERALQTQCISQMRQIVMALEKYYQDYGAHRYGDHPFCLSNLYPTYITDESILVCPKDRLKRPDCAPQIGPMLPTSYVYYMRRTGHRDRLKQEDPNHGVIA